MRRALYMAAVSAARCNPALNAFYDRLIANGKNPKSPSSPSCESSSFSQTLSSPKPHLEPHHLDTKHRCSPAFTASSIAPLTADWLPARHDPLGARKQHAGLKARVLMIGARLDEAEFLAMADQRRHPVIAQAAGMETRRDERGPQRVHLDQRRQMSRVPEIEGVFAAGQRRTGRWLDRDDPGRPACG